MSGGASSLITAVAMLTYYVRASSKLRVSLQDFMETFLGES